MAATATGTVALTPREHIEEIRRKKFSIGGEENPLTEDLHQAVKNLSAELYAKDVHFLMELIQNAEDNEYLEGVDPALEFVITSKDITGTGALATLLVFNNERGFSPKNIDSICSVGRSTKKGFRKRGYIGEKGIGFKSVFLITAQPYIFSNGYQIRFNERPCPECNVGFIVPEWVEENPTLSAIGSVYGSGTSLPTTTLVLPLKSEKVKPVKEQLSCIHPEVLLFLSKIKRLSVREDREDPRLNTVRAVSISSEKNFVTRKNIDAESYLLHLSADETRDNEDRECGYHMWRQRFPVKQESKIEIRMEVEEWVITLAFPIGKRLSRGMSLPGIYSFLPTETVTNLPFIIQADFLLASSRENILWDNKWNQGILDCVPVAFLNAFTSLVKSTADAPLSSLPRMFSFLPVNDSSHPKLNHVRECIREKLMNETIVPCESYMEQKLFRKPQEVGRLMPAFWDILKKARNQGVNLNNISSHGVYVLSSSFDKAEYNSILKFLGIEYVSNEWYGKCIRSSNLVLGVSEDVYLELLSFVAENWRSTFQETNVKNVPLLKYVSDDGSVYLLSIRESDTLLLSSRSKDTTWLINWNKEFRCLTGWIFLPKHTEEAMESYSKMQTLKYWLRQEVKVCSVEVSDYAKLVLHFVRDNRKLLIAFAHFLHHSLEKKHLPKDEVEDLCRNMPLVDNYGQVVSLRNGVLVPASGSRWVELIGSNPWRQHAYVELGEDYLRAAIYAGIYTPAKELVTFLQAFVGASDVPNLSPPNAAIPTMSSPLTKANTFVLLNWIRQLRWKRTELPSRFLSSIKDGSWLKISLSGCSGWRPPSQSFMLNAIRGDLLQNGSVLVDIPLVDRQFYGDEINGYKDELRTIGVMFEDKEACEFIGKHLMSLAAASTLTRGNVFSILRFIKFLRESYLSPQDFIYSIKGKRWLITSIGYTSPENSVLFSREWSAAAEVSDIPFIDQTYYGEEVLSFKTELKLLGVVVDFEGSYQLVVDNLKHASHLNSLTAEAALLMLKCIRYLTSPEKVIKALKGNKCMKTNLGYKLPTECFLANPESEWEPLLHVFNSFPLISEAYYGRSIWSFINELRQIGVLVDLDEASKEFCRVFKKQASFSSITKENVLSLLACYKKLKTLKDGFPSDLKKCVRGEKWLKTRLGDYRSPHECILFGSSWESISKITLLPFIDDSKECYGEFINDYEKELKGMGVITDLKDGAKFVAASLRLPHNASDIIPASVYDLLECVKKLEENKGSYPADFIRKVDQNWLKTSFGYRSPSQCLLYDSPWDLLREGDGPFIDHKYYGPGIKSYKKELNALGVTLDVKEGCSLLACYIYSHSNFTTINRIYDCLCENCWEPVDPGSQRIWIPSGSENGEWAAPQDCVLYDKSNLFGMRLNVLDKHYEKKLLVYFAKVFEVKVNPSVDDYCKLWKLWEGTGHDVSHSECCSFWEFVVKNWNPRTEETFTKNILKLPVFDPVSDRILLFEKCDVFIADDLFLKDLLGQSSSRPLFVWYPQPSLNSLPRDRLQEIFSKIGARKLSDSVKKDIFNVEAIGLKPLKPEEVFMKRGLFKLILGFLADIRLKIEAKKRHEAVGRLCDITAFETTTPVSVGYSLSLSSGEVVSTKASRMISWEQENSKFYMQKMETPSSHRNVVEYASHFAEVVAEGVLWEDEDLVKQLTELIQFLYLVGFDEQAVDFLMKAKNLQIFLEDQEYLSSTFSSD